MSQKSKQRYVIPMILLLLTVVVSGCNGILVGGYEHYDMSQSPYRNAIQNEAERLEKSNDPQDWRLAAELYGSIGGLEQMDRCVVKFFNQDPVMGKYLLMRADKIHTYYNAGNRRNTKSVISKK